MKNMERELSIKELELVTKLKSMKFSGMAEELRSIYSDPNSDLRPFDEKIEALIEAEWDTRYNKKLNRFIKKAELKYPAADLDESIYDPDRNLDTYTIERLSECKWIDERRNVLVTGQSGSGKSYVSCALGVCALRQFKTVLYISADKLINKLSRAEKDDNINEMSEKFSKVDLLIIDDFGLNSLEASRARHLFNALNDRENKSNIIISQLPVSSWYETFVDHTYAEGCLNRMLDGAYRIEMNGANKRNLKPLEF